MRFRSQTFWSRNVEPAGVVLSNRNRRTLLDTVILLIGWLGLKEPFY